MLLLETRLVTTKGLEIGAPVMRSSYFSIRHSPADVVLAAVTLT